MTDLEFFTSLKEKAQKGVELYDFSSVGIGVIKDGEVVFADGVGMRDIENSLPANGDTMYQIGSCSKAFTAALCAIMVDQGKLKLDVPIKEYVPEVSFVDKFVAKECTLLDLLSHRTGLPRHEYAWYGTEFTREELVDHMRYFEPNVPFRTKMQYNNYGYVLAGYIVEKVTGKTWEENVQELIFDPLGMTRSNCYIDDIEGDDNHAVPYDRTPGGEPQKGQVKIPFYKMPCEDKAKGIGAAFGPAGSINSTPADMLKWVNMFLNKGKAGDVQVISEEMVEMILKPHMIRSSALDMPTTETEFMNYGLGWFVELFRGHKFIQHGGNVNGFSAFTSFVPDMNLGVVCYTNMDGAFLGYAIGREIIDHYMGVEDGNWIQRYYDFQIENAKGFDEVIKHFTGEKVEGTKLSHPECEYAGTYRRDGYSDMVIRVEDGKFYMDFLGKTNELKHFHYDTFQTTAIVGELPPGFPAHFHTAEVGGAIDEIAMPLVTEPGGSLVRFHKVKD